MKINLLQAHNSKPALMRLAGEKLPTKIAYRIQKNIRALEPLVSRYQTKLREIVFTKYKCKHVGNGVYEPADRKLIKELDKEVSELRNTEVEVHIFVIPITAIESISALDLIALDFMLAREDEKR